MSEPNTAERLVIRGGTPLHGDIVASGAKNSALKLLPASLLAAGRHTLTNVPDVVDVRVMYDVLRAMGVDVTRTDPNTAVLDVPAELDPRTDYELTSRMRASIQVLGPLLARFGRARVAMPGGCNLGARKLDLHLRALEEMGAVFDSDHGDLVASTPNGLRGRRIVLEFPSMGATENVIMAAVGADGDTELDNAAREPEIEDLCGFLNRMGAKIEGAGTTTIRIQGGVVDSLTGADARVLPDRIETGTYLIAAATTDGEVRVVDGRANHLDVFLAKLEAAGVEISADDSGITARRSAAGLRPVDVVTLPYPGFPTDLMPQMTTMLALAPGVSLVTENLFDGRFQFMFELQRMGANVRTEGRHAVVTGVDGFEAAPVVAHDIRGGAAVVCAALAADGEVRIDNVHLIDRGYERIVDKLRGVGADIERI